MQNDKQDVLTDKIRDHLDDTVAKMDGHTLSRLRQARAHAIDNGLKNKTTFPTRQWLSVGLVMASLVMLTVLLMPLQPGTSQKEQGTLPATIAAEDLDILTQPEDLELYEDLEFY
ncbi:MAG: hypothetical protein OQL16_07830, partial [Gammaproteobacteria bacterium]|nr:hypothetical protein [Gammaproteobacteria bacterium]